MPLLPLLLNLRSDHRVRIRRLDRVLLDEPCQNRSDDTDQSHPDGRHGETWSIPRRVSTRPEENTVDGRGIAEGVDEGDGDGAFLDRCRDDVGYPCAISQSVKA